MKKNKILIRPLYTEKIAKLGEKENKYAFEVYESANKIEIKNEIEKKFVVNVVNVNTIVQKGKIRQQLTRGGRFYGRRPNWKKAIVTLAEGEKIELFENV